MRGQERWSRGGEKGEGAEEIGVEGRRKRREEAGEEMGGRNIQFTILVNDVGSV